MNSIKKLNSLQISLLIFFGVIAFACILAGVLFVGIKAFPNRSTNTIAVKPTSSLPPLKPLSELALSGSDIQYYLNSGASLQPASSQCSSSPQEFLECFRSEYTSSDGDFFVLELSRFATQEQAENFGIGMETVDEQQEHATGVNIPTTVDNYRWLVEYYLSGSPTYEGGACEDGVAILIDWGRTSTPVSQDEAVQAFSRLLDAQISRIAQGRQYSLLPTSTQPAINVSPTTENTIVASTASTISSPTSTPNISNNVNPAVYTDSHGASMLLVPKGEFSMGPNGSGPEHVVYLDDYYIDKYEVTNALYGACVNTSVCQPPTSNASSSRPSYFGNPEFSSYPVIYVTWYMANTFCQWRGARLPTEAEWEKASRGTDGRIYPWGNTFNGNFLNFCDVNCPRPWANKEYNDGYADTAPVGSYPKGASPYGVLDMAGNVYEWVADWYSENYYSASLVTNPTGPSSGQGKIMKGGAWSDAASTNATSQVNFSPSSSFDFAGFRCARSATP